MDKERWQKIKSTFETASGLSGKEREKFLDRSCGHDEKLRAEVEQLLNSFEEADTSFLEEPAEKEVMSQLFEKETKAMNVTTGEVSTAGFVAGTILDNRYRIIGLLGKGGMGEVYKAEDLKLDQTVALKFLPDKLSKNEDALKRFIGEVRTARQVSHENVCRVFDIGETSGKSYLSMEFIEGDDLSQLLRRIGRLPAERAVEISRQICFGLNAIHKTGILHRDLKPANVIIDSKGKARITDFGIAGFEQDVQGAESRVGTPAYMSPEQITGKEVTQKSDIYSLGLLIYEIFTGKQAVEGKSIDELIRKHQTTNPTNPTEIVENINPLVEKVINRCLEKNPADRPASALHVALALPGGNPLQVALEAGETPSPEMVAAAPKKGALKPLTALVCLAAFLAVLSGIIFTSKDVESHEIIPLNKSAEVLADRSRELLKEIGFAETPADESYRFIDDYSFFRFYGERDEKTDLPPPMEMLRTGQPADTYFFYRRSPVRLNPGAAIYVTENIPPLDHAGMVNVKLDIRGRLVEFVAVPSEIRSTNANEDFDWQILFKQAGLDFGKFEKTASNKTPPVFSDKTASFKGALADFPQVPITIETAQFDGKPVFFKIFTPWSEFQPGRGGPRLDQDYYMGIAGIIFSFLLWTGIGGALFFAVKNLKAGRVDLRGSLKLATFLFAANLIGYSFQFDFNSFLSAISRGSLIQSPLFTAISFSLSLATMVGIIYLAIEPIVRRRWPELLISWSRLLAGDFRDPMVGRDILLGGLLGICWVFSGHLKVLTTQKLFTTPNALITDYPTEAINGLGSYFSFLSYLVGFSTVIAFFTVFIALLFYLVTGRKHLSILAVGVLLFILLFFSVASDDEWILMPFITIVHPILLMICIWRYGLLGIISLWFFFWTVWTTPLTLSSSRFYFPQTVLTIVLLGGLAVYGYYMSIAGRPVFGQGTLQEAEK